MSYLQRTIRQTHLQTIWEYVLQLWTALCGLFWTVEVGGLRGVSLAPHNPLSQAQPNLTEASDTVLVETCLRVGAKDDRPFKELFRRHEKMVWRACYGFVRNADDAEDLMQEVFFKVYRSLSQFEDRSSFKTWLYRIAVNISQNEIRRRSRRPQESGTPVEDFSESLSVGDTPEVQVLTTIQNEQLKQAIESLKPDAAEAIKLKDLQQRPYAEIAKKLGISESAVKMRVQRARLALGAAYRELE